jgi:hypothetical protein
MNFNSRKNQEIKGEFVQREVLTNASQMIYELQQNGCMQDEILELFYSEPDYDQALENYLYSLNEEETTSLLVRYDVENTSELDPEQVCNDLNLDYEYLEPYEFWIVSDRLGEQLKEKGQIVVEFLGFTVWGRLTTGQAILLDHVISQICNDMEILEGQKYSWA